MNLVDPKHTKELSTSLVYRFGKVRKGRLKTVTVVHHPMKSFHRDSIQGLSQSDNPI